VKRLTAFVAILVIASVAVYAGPYLNAEFNPIDRVLPVAFGLDGVQTEPVGEGFLTLTGDVCVTNTNLVAWPSTWVLDASGSAAWGNWDISLSTSMYWDPLPWPAMGAVTEWDTTIELNYAVSDVTTVYGTATWDYTAEWSVWGFTPILGLDCDW